MCTVYALCTVSTSWLALCIHTVVISVYSLCIVYSEYQLTSLVYTYASTQCVQCMIVYSEYQLASLVYTESSTQYVQFVQCVQ